MGVFEKEPSLGPFLDSALKITHNSIITQIYTNKDLNVALLVLFRLNNYYLVKIAQNKTFDRISPNFYHNNRFPMKNHHRRSQFQKV